VRSAGRRAANELHVGQGGILRPKERALVDDGARQGAAAHSAIACCSDLELRAVAEFERVRGAALEGGAQELAAFDKAARIIQVDCRLAAVGRDVRDDGALAGGEVWILLRGQPDSNQ